MSACRTEGNKKYSEGEGGEGGKKGTRGRRGATGLRDKREREELILKDNMVTNCGTEKVARLQLFVFSLPNSCCDI